MKDTYCDDRTEGKNMKSEIPKGDQVKEVLAKGSSKGITTDSLSSSFLKGSDGSTLVETAIGMIKGSERTKDKLLRILMRNGIVNAGEIPDEKTLLTWKGCNKKTVRNLLRIKKMR